MHRISENHLVKTCFRKPHKTHKVVSYVNLTSNQVVYADGDFDPASSVGVSQLTDVSPPPRPHLTPSKAYFDPASSVGVSQLTEVSPPPRPHLTPSKACSSEQFRLPEGLNVSHFYPFAVWQRIKYWSW